MNATQRTLSISSIFLSISMLTNTAMANDWSGFNVGIEGGYGTGSTELFTSPVLFGAIVVAPATTTNDFDIDGGFLGISAGYDWQTDDYVYGLEAKYLFTDFSASDSAVGPSFNCLTVCEGEMDWLAMFRGKLGKVINENSLVYLNAGYAISEYTASGSTSGQIGSDADLDGWTVGIGFEHMFQENLSVKLEYSYVDFDSEVIVQSPGAPAPSSFADVESLNLFSIGLNLRF